MTTHFYPTDALTEAAPRPMPHSKRTARANVYPLKYGTLEITGMMVSRTQREDIYTSYETNQATTQNTMVIDFQDITPPVSHDRTSEHYRQYNPACSCCYLNFTHSTAKHDEAIKGN